MRKNAPHMSKRPSVSSIKTPSRQSKGEDTGQKEKMVTMKMDEDWCQPMEGNKEDSFFARVWVLYTKNVGQNLLFHTNKKTT